jgi:hypothetical protein
MQRRAVLAALLLLPAAARPADPEQAPAAPTDFIRFVEAESGDSLQTALAAYRRADGAHVDLVGAVHIADRAYYEQLNRRFTGYEAVLYEMVGGPHPAARRESGSDTRLDWLGRLQASLRKALELEGQLECVDYSAPNFVHADMTTDAFFQSQEDKKETFLSLWLKAVQAQQAAGDRPKPGLLNLLRILMSGDSTTEMKRLIGREFDAIEPVLAGVEAGDGTTIIGERNRHALAVLQRELAAGRKRLAIFYGAAHLPDMETRLLDLGFRRERVEYLKAWQLPPLKN